MKTSRFMRTLLLAHNRIGPACGPALRALLKNTKSLKVLSLSHNRLGELVRYPNKLQRDRVRSAASDIFVGLRQNKSLEGDVYRLICCFSLCLLTRSAPSHAALDVSYNSLGPLLADHVPMGVAKHPRMNALNLAGNGLGADKGAAMLFAMAGEPGGARLTEQRLRMLDELKHEDVATKILQQEEAREAFEEQEKRRKREERLKKVTPPFYPCLSFTLLLVLVAFTTISPLPLLCVCQVRGADGQVALVPMAGADEKNSLSALLARLAASEAAADGHGGGDNHSSAPSSARSKARCVFCRHATSLLLYSLLHCNFMAPQYQRRQEHDGQERDVRVRHDAHRAAPPPRVPPVGAGARGQPAGLAQRPRARALPHSQQVRPHALLTALPGH